MQHNMDICKFDILSAKGLHINMYCISLSAKNILTSYLYICKQGRGCNNLLFHLVCTDHLLKTVFSLYMIKRMLLINRTSNIFMADLCEEYKQFVDL